MSWIKLRTNLHEDPRVLFIATKLEVTTHHAVGMLVRLWCYADQHSTDGLLRMVSAKAVDEIVGREGFHAILAEVDWLRCTKDGVCLPRYGEHNGQTAKHRAQAALRAKRSRNSATADREEESRGEKSVSERNGAARNGGRKWM